MSKQTKNRKGKAGQSRFNRQWIREHQTHRARCKYGGVDKMTGQKVY